MRSGSPVTPETMMGKPALVPTTPNERVDEPRC
jgi:hypothetical protein